MGLTHDRLLRECPKCIEIARTIPPAPKDPKENALFREWINDRGSRYNDFAYAVCWKICQESIDSCIWWMDTFGRAVDPRKRGESAQSDMIVFPRQDEFLRFIYRKIIEESESWGSQKSRGFGLSVAFIDFCGWRYLWDENALIGLVSRKDDLVDSKNPDSLFWKLDYQLSSLPDWQREILIPGVEFRLGTEFRSKNILRHPLLPTTAIRGEATTSSVGAGGRASFYGVDEAGKIPFLDAVRRTLSGTTNSVGYISTDSPEGPDFTAMHREGQVEFFPGGASWRDNPAYLGYTDKNTGVFMPGQTYVCEIGCKAHPEGGKTHSDYFDKKMGELTPQELAQEFEMDAIKAGGSVFKAERVDRVIRELEADMASGKLKFDYVRLEFIEPENAPKKWPTDDELCRERGKWPVRAVTTPGGLLRIWKWPFSCRDPKCVCGGTGRHVYVIGGDTSSGYKTSDGCGAGVWDSTAGEAVALVHGQLNASELGVEVVKLAKFYGTSSGNDINAYVGCESNQEGATTNRVIKAHGILVHISRSDDKRKGHKQENRDGVRVTRANRNAMIAENIELEVNFGEGLYPRFICPFVEVWRQMRTFIEYAPGSKQGIQKPEATRKGAQAKKKDDLIWIFNHCLYCSRKEYAGSVRGVLRPRHRRFFTPNFHLAKNANTYAKV